MNGHGVSCVVFFFAAAITILTAQDDNPKASVTFSGTTVTLQCPVEDVVENSVTVEWYKAKEKQSGDEKTLTLNDYTDKNDGLYHCSYKQPESSSTKTHYFYIKAKVCEGCVEMGQFLAFIVVFADAFLTLVIVSIVYYFARKKSGSAPPQRATQARPQRGPARGPPTPDPDYQMLNPATRANDVYAQAQPLRK